ncbi:hypothetical protein FRB94_010119 [Tulasnella sp. JGI-2019a]|nr:hypothetical protein FRB94_010119 [Tulasnella sp. JGI-2019a]
MRKSLFLYVAVLLYNTSATPVLIKRDHALKSWVSSLQNSANSATTWMGLPNLVAKLEEEAGFTDTKMPTEVFTVPGYANWTSKGWNLRTHGTAYSLIPFTTRRLDSIGKIILNKYPRHKWTPEMRNMVHNMTSSLFSKPKEHVRLSYKLIQHTSKSDPGTLVDTFSIPRATNLRGEFDAWHTVRSPLLHSGAGHGAIQTLDEYTDTSNIGNATAYFVPEEGVTVVADIDDILRETVIWLPRTGLANSFGHNYRPWDKMPSILHSWQTADPTMHFHYSTTTPQPDARKYLEFIFAYYPPGSFDLRTMNLTMYSQIFDPRRVNLIRIVQSFPKRRFIIMGDTSNSDAMAGYPAMVALFPGQVQCILMRNISATDDTNAFPYTTSAFKGVDRNLYQFFRTPEDLEGIDFSNGGCRNHTFPQNVTFSTQYPSWQPCIT